MALLSSCREAPPCRIWRSLPRTEVSPRQKIAPCSSSSVEAEQGAPGSSTLSCCGCRHRCDGFGAVVVVTYFVSLKPSIPCSRFMVCRAGNRDVVKICSCGSTYGVLVNPLNGLRRALGRRKGCSDNHEICYTCNILEVEIRRTERSWLLSQLIWLAYFIFSSESYRSICMCSSRWLLPPQMNVWSHHQIFVSYGGGAAYTITFRFPRQPPQAT